MNNTQIENALARLFNEEGHRIVVLNDPEMEFFLSLIRTYRRAGL
jgi:hypothetical protein